VIRAIDLCCGAGGWACAARGLPIEWVAVADLAPDCLETWRVNHGRDQPGCQKLLCDLSTDDGVRQVLDAGVDQGVDLIVGGIPCEEVSVARGANRASTVVMDRLHALVDGIFGVIQDLEPRWWCLEDVREIEPFLPGPLLVGMPYDVRRIQARDYGPQSRLRSFIGRFPEPEPEPEPSRLASCLRPGPHLTAPDHERYEKVPQATGRNAARVGRDKMRVLDPGTASPTVMGALSRGSRQRRSFVVETDDGRHRFLGWQEAAMLQGFPEDYLFASGYMRAEKMVGQAIPIQVGRAILRAIVAMQGGAP
jgi:site-specific DNA-cytosine methylase